MNIRGEWNGAEAVWDRAGPWSGSWKKLIAFPDFFEDCEACLFRLAVYETESADRQRRDGNLAKSLLRRSFRNGRAVSAEVEHSQRENIVSDPGRSEVGVPRSFSYFRPAHPGHVVGPREVAGRLRPSDWRPASSQEERACYRAAVTLCGESMASNDADRRSLAFGVLVDHMDFLLTGGFLDEIAKVLTSSALQEDEARKLLNAVDEFLAFQEESGSDRVNERAICYIQDVRLWADSFRPSDFDGKLRSVCARDPWDKRFANDPRTSARRGRRTGRADSVGPASLASSFGLACQSRSPISGTVGLRESDELTRTLPAAR